MGRLLDIVATLFNVSGTLLIGVLMFALNADVIGRFFGYPIFGVAEFASMVIVAIVYLQITHCLRSNHLTRSDAFLTWLKKRRPRAAAVFDGICHLLGSCLFAVLTITVFEDAVKAYNNGDFVGLAAFGIIPVWPVKTVIVVGSMLVTLQFLRMALAQLVHPDAARIVEGGTEL